MKKVTLILSNFDNMQKDRQKFLEQKKMRSVIAKLNYVALLERKQDLKRSYIEAAKDPARTRLFKEWSRMILKAWEW